MLAGQHGEGRVVLGVTPPSPPSGCPLSVGVEGASGHAEPFPPRSVGVMAGWGGGTTCPPILCVGEVRAPRGRRKEQGEAGSREGLSLLPSFHQSLRSPTASAGRGPRRQPCSGGTSSPGGDGGGNYERKEWREFPSGLGTEGTF